MPDPVVHLSMVRPRPSGSSPTAILTAMSALPLRHPARPELRLRAIEAWLPLTRRLASRYHHRGQPIDDLAQVAAVGLIKAVDGFDPDRKVDFTAYATPTIVGEIKRHFRDRTWDVRVPRRLQEARLAISASTSELAQKLGRSPTVTDIAADRGLTEKQVLEGRQAALVYTATSLSAPVGRDSDGELSDILGHNDHGYELVEVRATLERAMGVLDHRDQTILALRFYGDQNQAEIAGQVGVSQMQVSRLIARSLRRLRHTMEPENG